MNYCYLAFLHIDVKYSWLLYKATQLQLQRRHIVKKALNLVKSGFFFPEKLRKG